jgi:putative FmdB family regulatory protein
MPLYEFQCNKCGYIFEEIHNKYDPIKIYAFCPRCKEEKKNSIATKILSVSNFKINGFNANNGYSKTKKD